MVFLGPRSNFVNPTSPSICGTFWHSFTGFGFHLPILQFFQFSHPFWDSLTLHPLFKGFFGTFSFPFFPSDLVGLLSHYSVSGVMLGEGFEQVPHNLVTRDGSPFQSSRGPSTPYIGSPLTYSIALSWLLPSDVRIL